MLINDSQIETRLWPSFDNGNARRSLRCVAYCGSKPKNVKTYLSWPSCAPPTPHTMSSSTRRGDTNNNPLNRELDTICPPKMKYHTRDSAPCTLYTTYRTAQFVNSRYSRTNLHQSWAREVHKLIHIHESYRAHLIENSREIVSCREIVFFSTR